MRFGFINRVHRSINVGKELMLKGLSLFCVISLCVVIISPGVAQVLDGPRGPVEFIGLKQWKASDLFESIQELDPDKPFHACAAVMKRDLEFPDAAAFVFMKHLEDGSMDMYTVVVGVEDSSGVRYRSPGEETIDLPEIWQKMQTATEEDFGTFSALVQARYQAIEADAPLDKAPMLAEYFGANGDTAKEVWELMDGAYEASDHDLALDVLAKDASWSARAISTMVLGYFPENDKSWHGLAGSLIDSESFVRSIAERVLKGLIRADKTVPIQWSEARESLLALFGGTNPFAFNAILEALVATEVDAEFALELVREKPDLLLAYAGAEYEKHRTPALDFLKAISGEDFGRDIEAWGTWIQESE
ncbi:MAG: hypothetical protein OXH84_01605 [Gammaproteobacteria bacterium]|nr:hypothetical protein [Gammaproteobacteria bacterium]